MTKELPAAEREYIPRLQEAHCCKERGICGPKLILAGPIMLLAGCRGPVLAVEDVIVHPGEKARLVAFAERQPILGLGKDISGMRVTFAVDGQVLGEKKTDDEGRAETQGRLPAGARTYEVRGTVWHENLRATGRVFWWNRQRVIIAVDVDHTIARTEYDQLLGRQKEDSSDPFKRSVKTLRDLALDFHIVYLTSRTRSLLSRTRDWLAANEFPEGPVLTSESFRYMLQPGKFKEKRLRELRKQWPTVLIGIGDRASDADAYGANEMLALIITRQPQRGIGRHALVFREWKSLAQFFASNDAVLTDPDALKDVIIGKRPLLRRLERYEPD